MSGGGILTLSLLILSLFAACGKRGDPLPPLRPKARPVTQLRVAQRGSRMEVTYLVPTVTVDGARLGVLEVELLRADSQGDFAKVARATHRKVAPGEAMVEQEVLPP